MLKNIFGVENTLFIGNTFVCKSMDQVEAIRSLLCDSVIWNEFRIGHNSVSKYQDFSVELKKSGSPLLFL